MSEKDVKRIESIAAADIGLGAERNKHKRTVKRIRRWQRRIWKAGQS